jgi:N6-L-threonylcarbamoyladenine synthase
MGENDYFQVVGVDTSCDDTCIGLVEFSKNSNSNKEFKQFCQYDVKIKKNIIVSQSKSCDFYGGVVPEVAARNHLDYIDKAFLEVVKDEKIDLICATAGPGLVTALVVGFNFAKTFSEIKNIPFIPVHHLEAHIAAARLFCDDFPFLALLISGGHTDLYLCEGFGKYKLICKTLDDAIGEVFDKVGKKFSLPFPAGPFLEEEAKKAKGLIKPMIVMKNELKFSFSGIKTKAVNLNYEVEEIADFLQESIGITLKEKLQMAVELTGVKSILVGGGVAANQRIREILKNSFEKIIFAPLDLCRDNGVMIALSGFSHFIEKTNVNNIKEFARMNLEDFSNSIL